MSCTCHGSTTRMATASRAACCIFTETLILYSPAAVGMTTWHSSSLDEIHTWYPDAPS